MYSQPRILPRHQRLFLGQPQSAPKAITTALCPRCLTQSIFLMRISSHLLSPQLLCYFLANFLQQSTTNNSTSSTLPSSIAIKTGNSSTSAVASNPSYLPMGKGYCVNSAGEPFVVDSVVSIPESLHHSNRNMSSFCKYQCELPNQIGYQIRKNSVTGELLCDCLVDNNLGPLAKAVDDGSGEYLHCFKFVSSATINQDSASMGVGLFSLSPSIMSVMIINLVLI